MSKFGVIIGGLLVAGGIMVDKPLFTALGAFVIGINLFASGEVKL